MRLGRQHSNVLITRTLTFRLAVFRCRIARLVGAWRRLGWTVVQDGRLTRLPAETFGLLPPLPQTSAPARA